VLQTVSLAHAEEADFSVLDVEALIRELSVVERCLGFRILSLNLTHLHEHALDDAVHFRLSVTDKFSFFVFKLAAESQEVSTSPGSNLLKKFNDDLGIDTVEAEHKLSVLGVGGVVDLLTEGVGSHLLVIFKFGFV